MVCDSTLASDARFPFLGLLARPERLLQRAVTSAVPWLSVRGVMEGKRIFVCLWDRKMPVPAPLQPPVGLILLSIHAHGHGRCRELFQQLPRLPRAGCDPATLSPQKKPPKSRLKQWPGPNPGLVGVSSPGRLRRALYEQKPSRGVAAPGLLPASHSSLVVAIAAQERFLAGSGARFPGS